MDGTAEDLLWSYEMRRLSTLVYKILTHHRGLGRALVSRNKCRKLGMYVTQEFSRSFSLRLRGSQDH